MGTSATFTGGGFGGLRGAAVCCRLLFAILQFLLPRIQGRFALLQGLLLLRLVFLGQPLLHLLLDFRLIHHLALATREQASRRRAPRRAGENRILVWMERRPFYSTPVWPG